MCPPLVFGPIYPWLQNLENINTSNQRIAAALQGKMKDAIPPTGGFIWVDVRDLALAHVKAIDLPAAENKRFFVTAGHFNNELMVEVLRDNFPDYKDKLPAKGTPGGGYPDGGFFEYDNSRSKDVLGLHYCTFKETVVDTAKSLQLIGA